MVIFDLILNNYTLSGGENGVTQNSPNLFGWSIDPALHPARYGVTVLVVLVLLALAVANIRRGDAGRRMLAVRSNERAAAALGVHVYAAKVYAFTVASAIAGVGGMLYAFLSPTVTSGNFDLLTSINFVTVTVVGGVGNILGAVIGATLLPSGVVTQIFFSVQNINASDPLARLVGLLLVLRRNPSGLFDLNAKLLLRLRDQVPAAPCRGRRRLRPRGRSGRQRERGRRRRAGGPAGQPEDPAGGEPAGDVRRGGGRQRRHRHRPARRGPRPHRTQRGRQDHVHRRRHGLRAARGGPDPGRRTDVTSWGARRRARLGIARTFQSLELFDDLTVRENLAVGADDGGVLRYLSDIVRLAKPG